MVSRRFGVRIKRRVRIVPVWKEEVVYSVASGRARPDVAKLRKVVRCNRVMTTKALGGTAGKRISK